MENKLITLAIHTSDKANILKEVLEHRGIPVFLEEINTPGNQGLSGFYVRIPEPFLMKALTIVEENKLFSYSDQQTYKIDDGRNRILVAVDFSDYSMNACFVAFNIAREINAKVKIIHVFQRLYFPSSLPFADMVKEENEESLLDRARKKMLKLCFEIDKKISEGEWPSVNYSYTLREGIVEEEIDNFIKEYKPVVVVIGTQGKHKTEGGMLGSVTADIIEMTDVPVLAVPQDSPFKGIESIKHIAFLTNFHERDLISFKAFVSILEPYNVKVTLVHINVINRRGDRWTEADLLRMKEYFLQQYPELNIDYKLIDSSDIRQSLSEFVEKEDVNIIALNTRRRNIFARMVAPSMSRKMLFKSNVALLVLRGK